MKGIIIFGVITLFFSCATSSSKFIPQNYERKAGKGAIFGTFSIYKKPRFAGYSLQFSKTDEFVEADTENDRIYVKPNSGGFVEKLIPDFEYDENIATYYFFFERPVGEYSFTTLNIYSQGYLNSTFYNVKVNLPFEIKEKQLTYIGEIIFDPSSENQGVFLNIKDEYSRDVKKFKEKFPQTDWNLSIKNLSKLKIIE